MMSADVQILGDINTIGLVDDEPFAIYCDQGNAELGKPKSRLYSLLHQLPKSASFQRDQKA
jgi:hypothetical protein